MQCKMKIPLINHLGFHWLQLFLSVFLQLHQVMEGCAFFSVTSSANPKAQEFWDVKKKTIKNPLNYDTKDYESFMRWNFITSYDIVSKWY